MHQWILRASKFAFQVIFLRSAFLSVFFRHSVLFLIPLKPRKYIIGIVQSFRYMPIDHQYDMQHRTRATLTRRCKNSHEPSQTVDTARHILIPPCCLSLDVRLSSKLARHRQESRSFVSPTKSMRMKREGLERRSFIPRCPGHQPIETSRLVAPP
jgi:hypothetical protein